jgi:hypothetical protein
MLKLFTFLFPWQGLKIASSRETFFSLPVLRPCLKHALLGALLGLGLKSVGVTFMLLLGDLWHENVSFSQVSLEKPHT